VIEFEYRVGLQGEVYKSVFGLRSPMMSRSSLSSSASSSSPLPWVRRPFAERGDRDFETFLCTCAGLTALSDEDGLVFRSCEDDEASAFIANFFIVLATVAMTCGFGFWLEETFTDFIVLVMNGMVM
jgi:hypothetical protein